MSKFQLFFFEALMLILIIIGQVVLISTIIEFQIPRYGIKVEEKVDTDFFEPVPIAFERNGYFLHNRSFYALGELENLTTGHYLFQIDFNDNFQDIQDFKKYLLPDTFPSLGNGLAYNNGLYWSIEKWKNHTMIQQIFCFSKDMAYSHNFSLNTPAKIHSMDLKLKRQDLGIWNNTLWILEWWYPPTKGELKVNVSSYSIDSYSQKKSFEAPIRANALFFDNKGQLWLYEVDYHPGSKLNFITIDPNDGKISYGVQGYSPLKFLPPDQNGLALQFYYPTIHNESIIQPVGINIKVLNLWGFQVIPFRQVPFPIELGVFGILCTLFGFGGGIFIIIRTYFHKRTLN
jgi:hypothetical protein